MKMKKYKRKTPLISPLKMAIASLYAAIATAMIIIISGFDNEWCVICGGIAASLLIGDLFLIIGVGGRYRYSDTGIDILYQSLAYKKLDYLWFSAVVISNASYNNGYGYGINGNIPMQYKVKSDHGYTKVTFPFITLHKPPYPVDKIKAKMNSRDLFMLGNDDMYCLGICWFDSLTELLNHTKVPVYVLEDVYLRFKGKFDEIFMQYEGNRCFIITDRKLEYRNYIGGKIK